MVVVAVEHGSVRFGAAGAIGAQCVAWLDRLASSGLGRSPGEVAFDRLLQFGVADETAWKVGLACGGKIGVYVEPIN